MKRHPNYKGGSTTDQGYRLVYVGKAHHLADCRGYAYEHRVNAEKKLGRRLRPGEVVHHDNRKRSDNLMGNLITKKNNGIHISEHLRKRKDLRPIGSINPTIECACGCGRKLKKYDKQNRPRPFIYGHSRKGKSRRWDNKPWSKTSEPRKLLHIAKILHKRWGSVRTKARLDKAIAAANGR